MMDSFKVYLPSNTSSDVFPNNTASDYTTRFDTPLELKGQWEVGLESVFYSSQIDYTKEQAQIHCHAEIYEEINEDASYPLNLLPHLTEHGKVLKTCHLLPLRQILIKLKMF